MIKVVIIKKSHRWIIMTWTEDRNETDTPRIATAKGATVNSDYYVLMEIEICCRFKEKKK